MHGAANWHLEMSAKRKENKGKIIRMHANSTSQTEAILTNSETIKPVSLPSYYRVMLVWKFYQICIFNHSNLLEVFEATLKIFLGLMIPKQYGQLRHHEGLQLWGSYFGMIFCIVISEISFKYIAYQHDALGAVLGKPFTLTPQIYRKFRWIKSTYSKNFKL